MKGKRRIFGFAALLSVLLAVPLVFALGIVDLPKLPFGGTSSTVEPLSAASVFVDPAENITDYEDAQYNVTIGSTVTFNINISGVTDLFVWAINLSWNPDILNVSRTILGEFLATSVNLTSSEELGWVMNSTDNALGYSLFAESILADVSGISGSGRLVSIEFLIVGYGHTDLTIGVSGTLPTMLLDSEGVTIGYDTQHGYFANLILGDMMGDPLDPDPDVCDGDVDGFDLGEFADAFGTSTGQPNFNRLGDLMGDPLDPDPDVPDGDVDGFDLGVFADNFGRSISLP